MLEPEEIAAAVPESDKTLAVSAFIRCRDIDSVYFDRPYYLVPADPAAEEPFALIREGMRAKEVAALAQAVLFRRMRTVLIRAHDQGLIATTLRFDYEVRSAKEAFDDIREIEIEGEMLDLAQHIIETKSGAFDPQAFEDRYEAALAELVRAKQEGRPIERRKAEDAGRGRRPDEGAARERRGRGWRRAKGTSKPGKPRPRQRRAGSCQAGPVKAASARKPHRKAG